MSRNGSLGNSNHANLMEKVVTFVKFESFFSSLKSWGQSNSLWPMPFMSGCCSLEYMASHGLKYDMGRFGLDNLKVSPKQADLLIVAGTVTEKQAPILCNLYDQMSFPKWVIAVGSCAISGGLYKSYSVVQGVEKLIPVDAFVVGCPPTPEALMQGLTTIKEKIKRGECEASLTN